MSLVVPVQEWTKKASSREEAEGRKVSSIMKDYLDLYGDLIMGDVRERFSPKVKAVEVETLLGIAPGYSRGMKKILYCSPEWGTIKRLLLLFGRMKHVGSFKTRIGKRDIKVNVYL